MSNFRLGLLAAVVFTGAALIVWGSLESGKGSTTSSPAATDTSANLAAHLPSGPALPTQNKISVPIQADGFKISLSLVDITVPGYVVIQKDENGRLGEVVAYSSLLLPGHYGPQDLTLHLVRNTLSGEKFWGVLYADNGNLALDLPGDRPIMEKDSMVEVRDWFYVAGGPKQ